MPPQGSRILAIALLVTAACGSIAAGAYFASRDNVFARLIDRQTEMERVEQQVKALLEWQTTFEQRAPSFADESIHTRNGWPASGTVTSPPLLSPIETPSVPIVAIAHAEPATDAKQAVIGDKTAHRPIRKHARVIRKRTQKAPTAADNAHAEPAVQQNY